MSANRFELRSVARYYAGQPALVDVSCTFVAEENTAILGPSGCGKSTLLRILAGLEAPTSGQVLLNGAVISEPGRIILPPHQRGVGMVFQDLALWPNLSVLDNVLLGLAGARLPRQEAQKRAQEALDLCGISDLAGRKPGSISGGQQQRAALARAVAARPRFLLLDEPFSGLDLVTKTRLLGEIALLAQERELTVLLVSHDPLEVTTVCRSAVVLELGKVTEAGVFTELLQSPRSEILSMFRKHIKDLTTTSIPVGPPSTERSNS